MKKPSVLTALIVMSMMAGCSETCSNQIKTVVVENATEDSVLAVVGGYPANERDFDTIPPYGRSFFPGIETDDIDHSGLIVCLVSFGSVDRLGLMSIVEQRLYDTIFHYSRSEIESLDYHVKFISSMIK